jgi:hypothetical protein
MHFESSVKNSPFLFLFFLQENCENQHPSHGDWSFNLEKHKSLFLVQEEEETVQNNFLWMQQLL